MDWFKFQTAVKSDRGTTSQLLERGRPKIIQLQPHSANKRSWWMCTKGMSQRQSVDSSNDEYPVVKYRTTRAHHQLEIRKETFAFIARWQKKSKKKKNPSIIALNVNFTSVLTLIEVEMGICVHVIGFTSVLTLKKIISKCGIRFHSEYKKTTLN